MSEEATKEGLSEIIKEFSEREKTAAEATQNFVENFKKFTGFHPGEQMTAFKVLQMYCNLEGQKK